MRDTYYIILLHTIHTTKTGEFFIYPFQLDTGRKPRRKNHERVRDDG